MRRTPAALRTASKAPCTTRMFSGVPSRLVKSADSALAGTRSRCRDESYAARWRAGAAPIGKRCSEAELIELIDQLLEAERPRAAFHSVSFAWPLIETSRLKRLLRAVAAVAAEPGEHYRLDPYQLSKALKTLSDRPNVGRRGTTVHTWPSLPKGKMSASSTHSPTSTSLPPAKPLRPTPSSRPQA